MRLIKIKVSYLVSYDYQMFLTSVKQLYSNVDKIIVGIDKDCQTWSGNSFVIPDTFFDEVKAFDTRNIIEFYFDNFYVPTLGQMECETRERNMVLKKLGRGWKVQLDVDEYVYDFKKVAHFLKKQWYYTLFPSLTPICYNGTWITLFKEVKLGYLYIENEEKFPMITNLAEVTWARHNNRIQNFNADIKVLHQSWARSEEDILFKIKNWGHCKDFDVDIFFSFWQNLNIDNYFLVENFHPLVPTAWNRLFLTKSDGIDEFISEYGKHNPQKIKPISRKKMFKIAIERLIVRI